MTYFHRRMPTIIGAGAFHRPVRDGKGWFHSAMVVRQRGGDRGFSWIPHSNCPGCRRSCDPGPTALITPVLAGALEEGLVGLRLYANTHRSVLNTALLKIIGSSLTGN